MAPLYGWSPVGERCVSCVPHGHWLTQTFIAGLTPSGIIAPSVFDGPINGESFLAYVEQVLVPELSERNTGQPKASSSAWSTGTGSEAELERMKRKVFAWKTSWLRSARKSIA